MYRLRLCSGAARWLHTTAALREILIKMPSLSPTMETGTIVKWLKKEGDPVESGDILCEIQTDKAVVGMETDDEGTMARIVMPENSADIPVGQLIALMAEEGEDWKNVKVPEGVEVAAPSAPAASAAPPAAEAKAPAVSTSSGHISNIIGPAVKLLLKQHKLDANAISHSGPHGVLLKGDVLSYVEHGGKSSPAPAEAKPEAAAPTVAKPAAEPVLPSSVEGQYTDIPLSNMRKTIAKRLTESKTTIPHAYCTIGVNMTSVIEIRKQLKADGLSATVNDFIIKSVAAALRAVPQVNVQYVSNTIRMQGSVDISVAVATEEGLITPIVQNADTLGVTQISAAVKELAGKAKEGTLQLHEFQGGSFTVSNLGMFGISEFTAIINPPQAAILAVGGSINELGLELETIPRMHVTLCFDNRAVSETDAARFLEVFRDGLEDPDTMLMGGIAPEKHDDTLLAQLL